MVGEFFEVVVGSCRWLWVVLGGCRSFLLFVTTEVLFTSRISFAEHIVISRALDIYALFKMVFDCLWVVVDVFPVVVDGY